MNPSGGVGRVQTLEIIYCFTLGWFVSSQGRHSKTSQVSETGRKEEHKNLFGQTGCEGFRLQTERFGLKQEGKGRKTMQQLTQGACQAPQQKVRARWRGSKCLSAQMRIKQPFLWAGEGSG